MTSRRTPFRHIHRTIVALLSVAVTASLTLTSAAIAQAAEPVYIGPDESQTQLTPDALRAFAVLPTEPGTFASLDPARILDTRVGNGAPQARVAASGVVGLQVTGRAGVPDTGVAAVVVNVTVTGPSAGGFITVYPSGTSQPTASNLNFSAGETIPNLVTVKSAPTARSTQEQLRRLGPSDRRRRRLLPRRHPDSTRRVRQLGSGAYSGHPGRERRTDAAVAAQSTVDLQVTGRGGVPAEVWLRSS